jgi:hypothetical protein
MKKLLCILVFLTGCAGEVKADPYYPFNENEWAKIVRFNECKQSALEAFQRSEDREVAKWVFLTCYRPYKLI